MTAKPTGTRLAGRAEPVARPFARHKRRGHRFARYAEPGHKAPLWMAFAWRGGRPPDGRALQGDDLIILVKSQRVAERVLRSIMR